ncbi:hypothetical protein AAMO2058_001478200 [Amorphochlora amoebiformis]
MKEEDRMTNCRTTILSLSLSWTSLAYLHAVALLILLQLTNDPLNTGLVSTLDPPHPANEGECVLADVDAIVRDTCLFFLWFLQHSGMARPSFKSTTGILHRPEERGLYGLCSLAILTLHLYLWKPIYTCYTWNPFNTPLYSLIPGILMVVWGLFSTLSLSYLIPDHLYGVSALYNDPNRVKRVYYKYPYSMVRHPASGGWLFFVWGFALLSLSPNHAFWAFLWTIYIFIGTKLEEMELRNEFGQHYNDYAKQVPAFCPKLEFFYGNRPVNPVFSARNQDLYASRPSDQNIRRRKPPP